MAVIAAAGIAAAASIFGSSKSASASKDAANAQREAAQLQTLVARELHDHWKANYRACDTAAITEVCAIPKYVPQYELWEGRSRLEILRSFARARDVLRKCQDVYCIGRAAQQCNYIAGIEAVALVDSVNFGYRFEESQRIALDQQRLANQYNWLGLGRNLLSQSMNASSLASTAAYRLGAQAGQQTNGWLQAAGWLTGPEGKKLLGAVSEKLFPAQPTPSSAPGTNEAVNAAFGGGQGIAEQPSSLQAAMPFGDQSVAGAGNAPFADVGLGSVDYST